MSNGVGAWRHGPKPTHEADRDIFSVAGNANILEHETTSSLDLVNRDVQAVVQTIDRWRA